MADDEAAYCADQVRRFDHERWLTTLVAPADARRALLALYAFNVELARTRETIREPHMGLIRLQWWREAIAEARAGSPRRHPVVQELVAASVLARLPPDGLPTLIDARERDLDDVVPATLVEVEGYAAATSGAVSAHALRLLGSCDERALDAAATIGTAWALVGLLRAAPHWAANRRCFLPADMVARAGLDLEAWYAGRAGPSAAPIVATIAARAAQLRESVERRAIPMRGFAAVAVSVLLPIHLRRLAAAGHDVFAPALQGRLPSAAVRIAIARALNRW